MAGCAETAGAGVGATFGWRAVGNAEVEVSICISQYHPLDAELDELVLVEESVFVEIPESA